MFKVITSRFGHVAAAAVVAVGSLLAASSADAALSQRAQNVAAGNAFRASVQAHNEVAAGAARAQAVATAVRNWAVRTEIRLASHL